MASETLINVCACEGEPCVESLLTGKCQWGILTHLSVFSSCDNHFWLEFAHVALDEFTAAKLHRQCATIYRTSAYRESTVSVAPYVCTMTKSLRNKQKTNKYSIWRKKRCPDKMSTRLCTWLLPTFYRDSSMSWHVTSGSGGFYQCYVQ